MRSLPVPIMEKKHELATKSDVSEDCALGSLSMDDKRLLRKIDWQILPIMFLTYFLQMIDKISINVSAAMLDSTIFDD
jgi:hypothetical protein